MECCGVFPFVQIKIESRRVNYDQERKRHLKEKEREKEGAAS
jgi:hypothetical protein